MIYPTVIARDPDEVDMPDRMFLEDNFDTAVWLLDNFGLLQSQIAQMRDSFNTVSAALTKLTYENMELRKLLASSRGGALYVS